MVYGFLFNGVKENKKEKKRQKRFARTDARQNMDTETAFQTASRFVITGQLNQAIQILEDIRRANPEHFDATLGLAVIRGNLGNALQ